MTALTADQLDDIRQVVGDSCDTPLVADATVQAWYDATPDCMAQVYVYYLERLWAKAINEPKNLVTLANVAVNVKATNLKAQINYWSEAPCVLNTTQPTLAVGALLLGIDSTDDNLDADILNW